MAVVIEKRPIGVVLGSAVPATINSDYSSAFATVNKTAHGLTDGMYVYIISNVQSYNGFWRIDVRNSGEFLLINNPYVEWIKDADITYYAQTSTHGWSCAHLPIVYELSNTRFPTNSVDTVRTINSIQNDNGLLNVNLSGSLGTFEDLAFVKISNAPNSDFNGIWQVLDKLATNDVTLNLDYTSTPASGIVGASIQLYYSNYNFVVEVWAGINASHEWADQKPYELAATLELIPDENNRTKFSINEILKAYVETKNNLLLDSLPNNIDAWTGFYIKVGEQYDTSNGYTITTFEGALAQDSFEGYAANAKLPFKNVQSGYLSEYVMPNNAGKFLTLFTSLVLFEGCYQDVSFIYSETDIYNFTANHLDRPQNNGYEQTALGAGFADWSIFMSHAVVDNAANNSEVVYKPNVLIEGVRYRFEWDVTGTGTYTGGGGNALSVTFGFYDSSFVFITGLALLTATGSSISSASSGYVVVPSGAVYLGIQVTTPSIATGSYEVDLNSLTLEGNSLFVREKKYLNGSLVTTTNNQIEYSGVGVYRHPLTFEAGYDEIELSLQHDVSDTGSISETKNITVSSGCSNQHVCLSFINNLGGFDYWKFTAENEHTVDIISTQETSENIFPSWPESYGETADTIRKQTERISSNRIFVTSQFVTQDQADALWYIKSSPLVQIVNSRTDRRTVIVDPDSFSKYKDGDKTYTVSFSISYTDDIPSQSV